MTRLQHQEPSGTHGHVGKETVWQQIVRVVGHRVKAAEQGERHQHGPEHANEHIAARHLAGLAQIGGSRDRAQQVNDDKAKGCDRVIPAERVEFRLTAESADQHEIHHGAEYQRDVGRVVGGVDATQRCMQHVVASEREHHPAERVERGERAGKAADRGAEIHECGQQRALAGEDVAEGCPACPELGRVIAEILRDDVSGEDEEQAGDNGRQLGVPP